MRRQPQDSIAEESPKLAIIILGIGLLASGLTSVSASGSATDTDLSPLGIGRLMELFKWAEYDSVIALGEPLSRDTLLGSKDSALVRANLGVAYYAKGRVIESAEQFLQSRRLDPGLTLDPLYVDSEIMDHYRFTLESQAFLNSNSAARIHEEQEEIRFRSGTDLALGTLGIAIGLAGSALAVLTYGEGEDAYEELKYAGSSGKPGEYAAARAEVRSADRRTLAYGALGAGGLIAGGCLMAEYFALKKYRHSRGVPASVSVSLLKPGAAIAFAF